MAVLGFELGPVRCREESCFSCGSAARAWCSTSSNVFAESSTFSCHFNHSPCTKKARFSISLLFWSTPILLPYLRSKSFSRFVRTHLHSFCCCLRCINRADTSTSASRSTGFRRSCSAPVALAYLSFAWLGNTSLSRSTRLARCSSNCTSFLRSV